MSLLEKYLEQAIEPPEEIIDYLLTRGVTRSQVAQYEIKYFSNNLEIIKRGLGWQEFERWSQKGCLPRNKLVFPLRNSIGELVGFTLQSIQGFKTKFIMPLSDYEGLFFGLPQALQKIWETEEVFIVEGAFDLLPIARLFENSLSLLTTNISMMQICFLERFVKRIFSLLDNDDAGENGFVKLTKKLTGKIEIIRLPYLAKDPNDLWVKFGEEGFQKAIKSQLDRLILI